uniref:Transmembrane 74B, opposite strand n=2 Tax=Peromyscus maniculatus bairdii TaxID=230844 RepID=A0A8C8UKG9_PERMB
MYKSKVPQACSQVIAKDSIKDTEMETPGEPAANLGQTLEWLRKELAEMQIQDQQLLLSLRHLQSLLEELQAESTHWEDTRSSRNTSPFRARLGSEGRGCQPVLGEVVQLLQGEESRRSSLP